MTSRIASSSSTTRMVSPRDAVGFSGTAATTGPTSVVAGNERGHRRADARFGVDVDVPSRLADDPVDRGQAEPGPLTLRLGGEERLEGVLDHFGAHTATGVAHPQAHVVAP